MAGRPAVHVSLLQICSKDCSAERAKTAVWRVKGGTGQWSTRLALGGTLTWACDNEVAERRPQVLSLSSRAACSSVGALLRGGRSGFLRLARVGGSGAASMTLSVTCAFS